MAENGFETTFGGSIAIWFGTAYTGFAGKRDKMLSTNTKKSQNFEKTKLLTIPQVTKLTTTIKNIAIKRQRPWGKMQAVRMEA